MKELFSPESLEGNKVIWKNKEARPFDKTDAIVVGCEPGIGVTIQQPICGTYLTCINFKTNHGFHRPFDEVFWFVVKMLRQGYYDVQEMEGFAYDYFKDMGPVGSCAFT